MSNHLFGWNLKRNRDSRGPCADIKDRAALARAMGGEKVGDEPTGRAFVEFRRVVEPEFENGRRVAAVFGRAKVDQQLKTLLC